MLDGVFNHTGRGFWAFHHVLENGGQSPYRDWFHYSPAALEGRRPFRPYPWPTDPADAPDEPVPGLPDDTRGDESVRRLGYRAWWGLPALPKLNTDNPEVREHLFEVAEHWLRFGIDGWRLDVPTEIRDEAFWHEFRRRCRAVNPEAYIVGEIWHEAPEWLAGDRFDAVMNYPLAQAILGFAAQGHLDEGVVRRHHEYGRTVHRRDGAAFAAELERLMGLLRPRRDRGPAQPPRQPRQPALPDDGRPRPRRATTSPCCSRRRSPARRARTTATRSASRATTTRTAAAAFPWDEGALGPRRPRVDPRGVRGAPRAAGAPPGHVPRRRHGGRRPRVRPRRGRRRHARPRGA